MNESLKIYKQLSVDYNNDYLDLIEIKGIIEALLFTAGEPLNIEEISSALQIDKNSVGKLLDEMVNEFNHNRRGIQIITFNDKYQLGTRPEHIEFIHRLYKPQNKQNLSKAAIETVAIIAYKQPVTRQGIDSIRGVKCDRIINNLIERKLIKDMGRMDTPGRPILYGTTDEFLKYFGLKTLNELPELDSLNIEI